MAERGGEIRQEPVDGYSKLTRRAFLKAIGSVGMGVVAAATGIFTGCKNNMREQDGLSGTREAGNNPERWVMPVGAFIIDSAKGIRASNINPTLRSVLTKEGEQIGQVFEATIEANSRDKQASLEFRFNNPGECDVLTSGWQSWSTTVTAASAMLPAEKLIGRKLYKKSLGGKTVPYFEPGPGGEKIPQDEGRSYGWVGFRDLKGGDNTVLGVIPSLDSLEDIRYRKEGNQIIVSVRKNLEGVTSQRPVTFKVFLGHADRYADLMMAFSGDLSRLRGNVPLMKDRVIGFSWPTYGTEVTQAGVKREIEAGAGMIDMYTIDDGWEKGKMSGSLRVDPDKFPNLPGLVKDAEDSGVKICLWVSPFRVKEAGVANLPRSWFMKDGKGGLARVNLPGPFGPLERYGAKTIKLDVSVPEVRAYLIEKLTGFVKMGIHAFKMDYLAIPFTGELQNKDKTSVEYYRQFIEEFRQHVRDEVGVELELIGCGAPVMESIGLFNGLRVTDDSAFQDLGDIVNRTPLSRLVADINTGKYTNAAAVMARRILPLRGVHGLILDGVHIADEKIPFNTEKRNRLNKSLLALNRLGIGSLYVGDALSKLGEQGRQVWRDFIRVIKRGNEELIVDGNRLPEIPERFAPPKAA